MYINSQKKIYFGDCVPGDRSATPEEIDAHEAGQRMRDVNAKLMAFRSLRETAINRLNGVADRLARKGDATVRGMADAAIDGLLDMTKDLPVDPALVDDAIMVKYLAIRSTLPQSLHKAFAGVDE